MKFSLLAAVAALAICTITTAPPATAQQNVLDQTGFSPCKDIPAGRFFDINWSNRDGETRIFIGRHDFYGKGIASEAVRLRMAFIWNELGLHRTHNWIALANRGSWRANQKSGYSQIGTYPRSWFRSGEWFDEWLGEAFPRTYPSDKLPSPWRDEKHPK